MKIRTDVAALVRAGLNNSAIARQLHCDRRAPAAVRAELGLPPSPVGGQNLPLTDRIAAHTQLVDGGHALWTGITTQSGTPVLKYRGTNRSVYQLVFIARYGREPVGNVRTACGYPRCLAPDHVEDRPMREKTRATYTAIFGRAP